jgi:response regulator RpfG family c-di-GMP phosphodiesterase
MRELLHALCVDDEPRVLEGLVLNLRRHFRVSSASSGQAGLEIVERDPPAVVVSDMRMPVMDGATFLRGVRERAPDAVRILLTGQTDLDSAIAAVNQGQIFRFLTKPCSPAVLLAALEAAGEQHRLISSERVLLEQTLRGSIQTLTEVMALSNPLAFGRASRLKLHAAEMVLAMGLPAQWQIEVATMLSQIGAITLPAATLQKVYGGSPLSAAESEMVRRSPAVAEKLLEHIPRLEAVIAIIRDQDLRYDGVGGPAGRRGEAIPLGARIIKIAADFDALESSGLAPRQAVDAMAKRAGSYDPVVLAAFTSRKGVSASEVREIPARHLALGMTLAQDVVSTSGVLLVARGFEVTAGLVERFRNQAAGTVREPVWVTVTVSERAASTRAQGAA